MRITYGDVVTIRCLKDNESIIVKIVKSNPKSSGDEISVESPIGKKLIDKEKGDEFVVALPDGGFDNYVVESIKRENNEDCQIVQYLKNRGIMSLIHFTRVENVKSIMENGICSVNSCNKREILPFKTDDNRYDKLLDFISFSIGYPNYKMMYTKEKQYNHKFVILIIDVDVLNLIPKDCMIFSYCNAAKGGYHNAKGLTGVRSLFYDEQLRKDLCLSDFLTTDPQAEILINETIESKYIKKIHTNDIEVYGDILKYVDSNIVELNNKYFKPRCDWEYWKKKENNNG